MDWGGGGSDWVSPSFEIINDEKGSKKEIDLYVNLILSFITVWP